MYSSYLAWQKLLIALANSIEVCIGFSLLLGTLMNLDVLIHILFTYIYFHWIYMILFIEKQAI